MSTNKILYVAILFFAFACSSHKKQRQPKTETVVIIEEKQEKQVKEVKREIYFAFDSSALSKAEKEKIAQIKEEILSDKKVITEVIITGNTDERGTEAYNYNLGQRRAESVKKELGKLKNIKVTPRSSGKENPKIPNAQIEGEHALNRNAVIESK